MKARFQKFFKSRLVQAVLIAILFLAVGIFLGINSWNKTIYVQLKPGGKGRYVASAEKTEIVSLSLEEYTEQIQKKVFGNARLSDSGNEFHLGSFFIQAEGAHQRICQTYSFVEMRFIPSNVSLSGSAAGVMVIQAPCQIEEIETEAADPDQGKEAVIEEFIGPFSIPINEILNNPEKDFFPMEEEEVSIRFFNAAIALTEAWLLTAVRFFNSPEEDGFIVRFIQGEETDAFELPFQ